MTVISPNEPITTEFQISIKELDQFQKDYDDWCLQVELNRVQVLDNKESRND